MSTTYTCTASGPYELFISIYRQEYNNTCVEVCVDNVSLKPQTQSLKVAPNDLSASAGGLANFTFDVGPAYAGKGYIIFASMSGSYPGLPVPPVTIHLNWDFITDLTLSMVIGNAFPFGAFHGTLDAQGKALPTFTLPGGNLVPASAALYFGGIVYDPAIGNAIIHSTLPSYLMFTP